ncbi:MAG: flagellar hook-associated protein FlgL [Thermodesulfobacteriota bacterium]|nr:flagellar hook-associated protein FlgL [Thermodesulfobacteriota bacterium]
MRISTHQFQQQGIRAITDMEVKLSKTQLQIATGKRVLTPADDPGAAARILDLQQSIDVTRQFQRNGEAATANLNLEESALDSVTDLLQRIRELAVQAGTDTLNGHDRELIAKEVRQILDEMLGLANTVDAEGNYIFAGNKGHTKPFEQDQSGSFIYSGDQGQREVQIASRMQVSTGDNGFEVFKNIPESKEGGGKRDIFSTVYNYITSLEADDPDPNILKDIDLAMDNILVVYAKVGAGLNAIEKQKNVNEQYLLHVQEALSLVADLDYAEAVSRLNQQMLGLQAAQQVFVRVQGLSLFNYIK